MRSALAIPSLLFGISALFGCAPPPHTHAPVATTDEGAAAEAPPPPEEVPADVVKKAARPFAGFRLFDAKSFSKETTLTLLASADAVCFGERHASVLDHYAELELLTGLAERRRVRGFELLVGMEMIRTEFQPNLDYFALNPTPFEELAPKLNWEEEWGFPRPYYAPLIEEAGVNQARLIALGLARQVSRTVARGGITALPPEQQRALPELDFKVPEHRALFEQSMEGHPPVKDLEHYYQVQVIWDESMAERAVTNLANKSPARKLLIFAGQNHCHRSAIPSRMLRRSADLKVVSVRVQDASADNELMKSGYDYEFVF